MESLFFALKNDDLYSLEEFCNGHENVNIIFEIEALNKIPEIFHYNPPIISIAAYYGSLKCIEWLIINNCALDIRDNSTEKMLPHGFAIANDKYDALLQLFRKYQPKNCLLENCIKFDRTEIFKNLINYHLLRPTTNTLELAIKYEKRYFVESILQLGVKFPVDFITNILLTQTC